MKRASFKGQRVKNIIVTKVNENVLNMFEEGSKRVHS